jgi:hypothetical protein
MTVKPDLNAPNGMLRPEVGLVGEDGNAYNILAICQRAMREAHFPESDLTKFYDEATAGDYNHLLQTAMLWCKVT